MTTASNPARSRKAMHALALAGILATSLPAAAFADDHRNHDWREHRHDGYHRDHHDNNRYDSGYNHRRRVQVVWIRHGDHWHPNYVNGRAWRNDYCGRRGYESYSFYGRSAPRGYYYYDSHYDGRKRDNTGAIVAGVGIGLLGLAIATSGN